MRSSDWDEALRAAGIEDADPKVAGTKAGTEVSESQT